MINPIRGCAETIAGGGEGVPEGTPGYRGEVREVQWGGGGVEANLPTTDSTRNESKQIKPNLHRNDQVRE